MFEIIHDLIKGEIMFRKDFLIHQDLIRHSSL